MDETERMDMVARGAGWDGSPTPRPHRSTPHPEEPAGRGSLWPTISTPKSSMRNRLAFHRMHSSWGRQGAGAQDNHQLGMQEGCLSNVNFCLCPVACKKKQGLQWTQKKGLKNVNRQPGGAPPFQRGGRAHPSTPNPGGVNNL